VYYGIKVVAQNDAIPIDRYFMPFARPTTSPNPPALSIIVPALNEAANLALLIPRIHEALTKIAYEVIVVDDHSTDQTKAIVIALADKYPVSYSLKIGDRGKTAALLQGFDQAKSSIIAMIDADLQYPPEALPAMYEAMLHADVVVARRREPRTRIFRRLQSATFKGLLHILYPALNVDVQSGLKVFRAEILQRVNLDAGPWSFDLAFLSQASQAGYTLSSRDIVFAERAHGHSHVTTFRTSLELLAQAIRLKLSGSHPIPLNITDEDQGYGFHLAGKKFVTHTQLAPRDSALTRMSTEQAILGTALLAGTAASLLVAWQSALTAIIALLTFAYFADLLFNLLLITRSFTHLRTIDVKQGDIMRIPESAWPMYTIFCPLYKESGVIGQFAQAMGQLDYPHNKLQVMLLLEENDAETIDAARRLELPEFVQIVIVPHSLPKTKPKACNFGLTLAKGEFSVIYDAEDIPDRDQLKKAVLAFAQGGDQVKCIQAKLNFYNAHQNILTRIFTAEYSLWFDMVLTGLQSLRAPIPLGGTSNHFRTADLRALNGWDAFNVTEDCDLGIRLVARGFDTAIIDSVTLEEANSSYINWFPQRTRWIKGYMQTYLVHMRHPGRLLRGRRRLDLVMFQLVVGGKILSLFINPLMWVLTILYFALRPQLGTTIETLFPTPVLIMGVTCLVFGNFLYLYYYMIACARRGHYELVKFALLVPIYWIAMSVAAYMAFYQLIVKPHYWSKTKHGLSQAPHMPATAVPEVLT
jgi:cellulose synthase/poly-beta-1,6-N-acetylglucosamine synthase-like glycosyltransferase